MVTSRIKGIKDYVFEWEGRDRNGKSVHGETRAGGVHQVHHPPGFRLSLIHI